jgi:hypothetical protein
MMHYHKWQVVEYIVMMTKRPLIMTCSKMATKLTKREKSRQHDVDVIRQIDVT